MKTFILFISILFLHTFTTKAQQKIFTDSSQLTVRKISPATIDSYRADKSFQYNRDRAKQQSFLQRLWNWFWDKYYELLGREGGNNLLKLLMWLFVIAGLSYFLLKVLGMDAFAFFGKRNKDDTQGYEVLEENLHQINFNEAIAKAIEQKNYRLAVRLLYLQSLKKLSDKNLINWQPEKTNRQYAAELLPTALGKPFAGLTNNFEYVWYGECPLVEEEFDLIQQQFISFQQQL